LIVKRACTWRLFYPFLKKNKIFLYRYYTVHYYKYIDMNIPSQTADNNALNVYKSD